MKGCWFNRCSGCGYSMRCRARCRLLSDMHFDVDESRGASLDKLSLRSRVVAGLTEEVLAVETAELFKQAGRSETCLHVARMWPACGRHSRAVSSYGQRRTLTAVQAMCLSDMPVFVHVWRSASTCDERSHARTFAEADTAGSEKVLSGRRAASKASPSVLRQTMIDFAPIGRHGSGNRGQVFGRAHEKAAVVEMVQSLG